MLDATSKRMYLYQKPVFSEKTGFLPGAIREAGLHDEVVLYLPMPTLPYRGNGLFKQVIERFQIPTA
jgi:hypothetical protein